MITESMQILACCQKSLFKAVSITKVNGEHYKTLKSRMNHPVVIWARSDIKHMSWLLAHCTSLYEAYTSRGGRAFKNIPANISTLRLQVDGVDHSDITSFFNFAKSDEKDLYFRHIRDVFEAYNQFLKAQGA
jgi:molybdopterin-guanine dinucleotide biosynthesis protein A